MKEELDLYKVSEKLTWHKCTDKEMLILGSIGKTSQGDLLLIGDLFDEGFDGGCGCCGDYEQILEVAYLSELFNNN